jgi:hypothetical protein
MNRKESLLVASAIDKTAKLDVDVHPDGAVWVNNVELSVCFFTRDRNKKRLYFCVNTETVGHMDVTVENSSVPLSTTDSGSVVKLARLMVRTFRDQSKKYKQHISDIAEERKALEKLHDLIWAPDEASSSTIASLRRDINKFIHWVERVLRSARGGKRRLVFSN